jgi:peptidoglycan-associated lipoprotein
MRILTSTLFPAIMAMVLSGCGHHQIPANYLSSNPLHRPPPPTTKVPLVQPARLAIKTRSATGDKSIYFNFDSYLLRDSAFPKLQKEAKELQKNSQERVLIEGNCDERGTEEYNIALGEHRALAAKRYLERLGIPSTRVTTLSYGKNRPKYEGHDEADWSKNRRDDFVVF